MDIWTKEEVKEAIDSYAEKFNSRELAEKFITLLQRFQNLQEAAIGLYEAGCWKLDNMSAEDQCKLWEDLRDAIGFNPGMATMLGVGYIKDK